MIHFDKVHLHRTLRVYASYYNDIRAFVSQQRLAP